MNSARSALGRVTRVLGMMVVANLPPVLAAAAAPAAKEPAATAPAATTQPPPAQSREAWRAEMARRPLPKKGCFKGSYPSTAWQEVPCGAPSRFSNQPQRPGGTKPGPNTVGNNNGDYSAQTSGLVSSAVGSFKSVTGASSVTGNPAGTAYVDPNVFMFQINTQFFPNPPACNGHAGCLGWQQFLFSQTQGPPPGPGQQSVASGSTAGVFMEYWLLGYGGTTCPPGQPWTSDGAGDCWFNGPTTYIPPQTIADLAGLIMTAATSAGGQDTVTLATTSGNLFAAGQDSVLSLAQFWNTAEFNVFGDCCSTETSFSTPTTLVIRTAINDGTTNAPTCGTSSFTAETNNLTLAPTPNSVCCPYGGASPAIEFMETDAGHTATCGPTALEGDPHLTAADGTHFDFQGAGEFVSLRDPDGMQIQTRQAPIATNFFPGADAHDGLATCVSINTAVAARVGEHRVTYEPNLSGVPDPSGLQLRIDGALTSLRAPGVALGTGGRVAPSAGGGLEVDFPDGRTLLVTPEWWASQSAWYLNVDVSHLGLVSGDDAAARGIAGAVPAGSWLPALPNGASMGPMPASVQDRYIALYQTFADAWRVADRDSLFDYAPGTSTATFTMRDWPKQNPPCTVRDAKPAEPVSEAVAEAVCRRVRDQNRHASCVFDVRVTGFTGFARTYLTTQRILGDSTTTSLTDDADPSLAGEWVTLTALVAPYSAAATGFPSGTVQFAVDGSNAGEPVKVDAKGRAAWETSRLRVGTHRVTARYVPGSDSAFLPSTSLAKTHEVRRCFCGTAHEPR